MKRLILTLVLTALTAGLPAQAAEAEQHHYADAAPACTDPGLVCATAATPLFARDGSLWLVWSAAGQVSLARSSNLGRSFGPAIALSPPGQKLDGGGDGRPVLVQDSQGRMAAAWAIFKDDAWNAQVLVSNSQDGGRSFSAPHPISNDPASQRFVSLAADGEGRIFATWIDKRGVAAARAAGQQKVGAGLAFVWSEDGGESFGPSRIFHDDSCECCRLAVALDRRGHPAVLFRSLYAGGIRDHALIRFADSASPGQPVRVSEDNWAINGCPHHGPSLSIAASGTLHAAWFTQGPVRQGLFYARSTDDGKSFSAALPLAAPDRHPARPAVLAESGKVWLAWKEFDGHQSFVKAMASADDGATWSSSWVVAQTGGASDHPLLVSNGGHVYLSWLTHDDGYRLLPLEATP
jgi:hypothetical protein